MELDLRWKRVGRNGDESNTEKREKVGKAGTSSTVSHRLTLVSCPFFDARNDQRERKREREREREREGKKRGICTYNTSLFYKTTSPNMGICGYNNRDNYTYVALSDNNYKAFYQPKTNKRDTEHRNY